MAVAQAEAIQLPGELTAAQRAWRWTYTNVPSFLVILLVWEAIARIWGDPLLFPPVGAILRRAAEVTGTGVIFVHSFHTAWRILFGMVIAIVVGVPIGILMGRHRLWEHFWLPILAVLLPIPALAWSPVLVLWFGLGNVTMIFIISFAAALPVMSSTWTGVKTVNPVWVRAAQSMRARGLPLFWKVIMPGALPFILSGIRIGLARAWRAAVAGEMVAASNWGLGYAIFDSQQYLDTAYMLTGIAVIGVIGFVMEKFIFQRVEYHTVVKWGMMAEAAGEKSE
jgi:NitT/TauT family transport system permease protein